MSFLIHGFKSWKGLWLAVKNGLHSFSIHHLLQQIEMGQYFLTLSAAACAIIKGKTKTDSHCFQAKFLPLIWVPFCTSQQQMQ